MWVSCNYFGQPAAPCGEGARERDVPVQGVCVPGDVTHTAVEPHHETQGPEGAGVPRVSHTGGNVSYK